MGAFYKAEVDMIHQAGYAQDDMLMQNKKGGNYRPAYYALKDETTSLT